MRSTLLVCFCLLPAAAQPRVGLIDFYGLRRVPAAKVLAALGTKIGDPLPQSKGDVEERIEAIPGVVRARLEAACCEDGKAILYVGVEEKGAPTYNYREAPAGNVGLPQEIDAAYHEFLEAISEAVKNGEASEDLTQGHSLIAYGPARAIQERFVKLAETSLASLRDTLKNSADEEQRAIAAYVIGYAPKKADVVNDLQSALRDPDDGVRNHATRSLAAFAVLAMREPEQGIKIQPTWFVEMLHSIIWTDRNNATVALVNLTETRDANVLALLRERALPELAEMARWKHLPHALPAFILVGRVAGLKEGEIQDAWAKSEREKVIAKALAPAAKKK